MSTTLSIVNGQIDIDPATGLVNTVTGNRKAAQDLGEVLLQDYDPNTDYGSYLRAIATNQIQGSGDLFFRYYIADAIQKLQASQQQDAFLTAAEQITGILALQLSVYGDDATVFFVSVSTADGGVSEVGAIQPTQMNQQYERF